MKRPEFTFEQEEWLCEALGHWYITWKGKMTENHEPHYLGIATEQLKLVLCGEPVNTLVEDIVRKDRDTPWKSQQMMMGASNGICLIEFQENINTILQRIEQV